MLNAKRKLRDGSKRGGGCYHSNLGFHNTLREEAVALKKEGNTVVLDCHFPHLIGIDEDLLSTGIVLYYLKEGRTMINTNKGSYGLNIEDGHSRLDGEHCVFENHAGTVTLIPQEGAMCSVNGTVVTHPCQLTQGAIIHLGRRTILRFNHPTEAAYLKVKQQVKQSLTYSTACLMTFCQTSFNNLIAFTELLSSNAI
ncbi:kinesin-like protein KIF16B [Syngnathus acus]|uniref:kinesin-like protein KIF16B n=1 Tax=Syngnathus acus TaxID=161584 RepID=UPI0018861048|nr:kinesin-like protein KIF16B [Syngnathus acus]